MNPTMAQIGLRAREAALSISTLSGEKRQKTILTMSKRLKSMKSNLFAVNQKEVDKAKSQGMDNHLIKRLEITEKVFQYMLDRLNKVAGLADPLNRILEGHTRPNGLQVQKISVPIGVIAIIYESRPNVTTDAASVCLKSGNSVILRGGSESLQTNIVLAEAMIDALKESGLPEHTVQIIRSPGHKSVEELLRLDQYIDVLIPRGGKPLIKRIAEGTNIPVIKHYEGICHLFLAEDAPEEMAVLLSVNSKCQRVEVCNALETLLIDVRAAERLLPPLVREFQKNRVELRGCKKTQRIIPQLIQATEKDWSTEYLAPILSIKLVDGLDEAIRHINKYGSGHTDAIVTQNMTWAHQFTNRVDSASVLVNGSTRLSGGGDYGLGAVVGISTDKLHARGPVGPNDLTSYKWVVYGHGHLRK